ncbi:MAG: DUF1573 domain-containing protein [Chitinispirillaceae bacterium]|nr:DUF1573 domain-containing protein [Chitinispirillaceae bacterium]
MVLEKSSKKLLLTICLLSMVVGGPKIEFDTKTYDCGTVWEGKTDKIKAIFTVKNTGDSVLKLESVRPGCGCTVVKFDSLIQPGSSAKIESEVNIKGYKAGPVSKGITVTSNAENEKTVRLTINVKIKAIIGSSEGYIELGKDTTKIKKINLTSRKKDLRVSSLTFVSDEKEGAAPWEQNLQIPLKYKYTPTDSMDADSNYVFFVEISPVKIENPKTGDFVFKTNHKEMPELKIRGRIGAE